MLEPVEQNAVIAGDDAAAEVRGRISQCFEMIAAKRMAGIPILNAALRVEVVGLQRYGGDWLAILITPWFMNIMLLPVAGERLEQAEAAPVKTPGSKEMATFPAGSFEMIHGFEASLGGYRMCSLFSPVLEFADQESAVAAAEAALDAILASEADDAAAEDAGMDMIWRGERPPRVMSGDEKAASDGKASEKGSDAVPLSVQPLDRRALLFGRKAQGGAS